MKKRNLVVANWKMNPETLTEAKEFLTHQETLLKILKIPMWWCAHRFRLFNLFPN